MVKRISPIVFIPNIALSLWVGAYVVFFAPLSTLSYIVLALVALSAIAQLTYFISPGPKLRKVYLYIVMLHVLYLLAEVLLYILFCLNLVRTDAQFLDGRFEANDRPWARYDSTIGYRGLEGKVRSVKYSHGQLVYDHTSHINKQGWFSKTDFVIQKTPGIKRYAVLGDSFSAGYNIPTPWADVAGDALDSIELYNFSLEGIGIHNWHLIYFNEVLKYEFDGVILALSNEYWGIPNIDRKLMIMHSTDEATYIGPFDSLPSPTAFRQDFKHMVRGYNILPSQQLGNVVCGYAPNCQSKKYLKPVDFYFLKTTLSVAKQIGAYFDLEEGMQAHKAELEKRFPDNKPLASFADYTLKYPSAILLQDIITDCKSTGKEVFLVGIPDLSGTLDKELSGRTTAELQVVAGHFGIPYFNGFNIFEKMTEQEIRKLYYQHDLHWNQNGANLFADRFASWVAQKPLP